MAERRDYYEVLGVPHTATADDIKQAYRRLARTYHPDMNRENPKAAEEKFKELSEAYEVLADGEKRRRYDAMGFSGVEGDFGPGGFTWQNFTHAGDLQDLFGNSPIFQQLFGNLLGGSLFGAIPRGPVSGRNVEVAIRLPLEAALTGARPTLEIPHSGPCPPCGGTGARDGTAFDPCPECHGRGQVQRVLHQGRAQFVTVTVCPACRGRGRRIREKCPRCRGSGMLESMRTLEVSVPPGVDNGTVLRLPGQGMEGIGRAPPGDLFVQVELLPDAHVQREGNRAFTEVTVPLRLALLGGETDVKVFQRTLRLKIPPGTQPEREFRFRGEGFPRFGGGGRGDLFVTLHVELPHTLSSRQRSMLEEALPEEGSVRRGSIFGRRS